jgi:hypothetical protein
MTMVSQDVKVITMMQLLSVKPVKLDLFPQAISYSVILPTNFQTVLLPMLALMFMQILISVPNVLQDSFF